MSETVRIPTDEDVQTIVACKRAFHEYTRLRDMLIERGYTVTLDKEFVRMQSDGYYFPVIPVYRDYVTVTVKL